MSLRKDPRSPYWQYDFQRDKRRFHGSTGCTAKRDAERFEAELKRRVALGDIDKRPITLDQACDAFWLDSGQHESSNNTTEYQIANLITIIGANKLLSEIRREDMLRFVARRRATVGNASINRELEIARRVWKHARAGGWDVPVDGTKDAIVWSDLMLDEPKERVRELLPAEERRLFKHLSADLAPLVEFAMLSGQRKAAIVGLLHGRVDKDGMRASVHTKGDVWHSFPLTPRMMEIIEARPVVEGCPFVFTYMCRRHSPARKDRPRRVKGKRYPYSVQGWNREWKTALEDAGITDFRFHDLRHTRATRLVRATGNLKAAQKLLGHSDISTTSRYAHVLEDDLRLAMSAGELRNSHGEPVSATPRKRRKTAKERDNV